MERKKRSGAGGFIFYLLIIAIIFVVFFAIRQSTKDTVNYTYEEFIADLEAGEVEGVEFVRNEEVPTGKIKVTFYDSSKKKTAYVSDTAIVEQVIIEYNKTAKYAVEYKYPDVSRDSVFLTTILPIIIIGICVVLFIMILTRQSGGGANSKMMNFGKSRAQLIDDKNNKVNFKNVAGLVEEKEELEEIVDFLKDPKKYIKLGARIPKGVLLVGPPGTGKTLLAKAIAGEAGVPFFSISGSDFVEMFVGVGASRVRDLFEEAKKNAPCIVFIDEIDAVARRRGTGMGGGHDERTDT